MELEGSEIIDHRVAGIVSATIANDDLCALAEQIDDPAFAFIAPLPADNCHNRHSGFSTAAARRQPIGKPDKAVSIA